MNNLSPVDRAKLLAKQREMASSTIDKSQQNVLKDKSKSFVKVEKVEFYNGNDDYDSFSVSTEQLSQKKNAEDLMKERENMI